MTAFTDAELYRRGCATMLASWEEYARGSTGAALRRLPGVAAAVFPNGPERSFYNNALVSRDLGAGERAAALHATEAAYAASAVDHFAVWVHEGDGEMRADVERRGYTVAETTRAMGMTLDDVRVPPPEIEFGPAGWPEYVESEGLAPGFLHSADHAALHVLVCRLDGEIVTAALAYDLDGDCGIYNVGTHERARRRGLGTAVTAAQLYRARARGCRTASLQSTPMAERVYAAVGFRDLGRFLEYAR